MPTSDIKELLKKWEDIRAMVLEWHPNQAYVSRDFLEVINSIVVIKIPNPTDISLKETHFVVFLGVLHSKFLGVLLSSIHLHVPLRALLCHPRSPTIPDL
ncbi:hypothetical protein TNCV_5096061 [Trichonephila clavipes]|nr:hypothetical protein TNCV_5096061 [Trichonephila clavipes]